VQELITIQAYELLPWSVSVYCSLRAPGVRPHPQEADHTSAWRPAVALGQAPQGAQRNMLESVYQIHNSGQLIFFRFHSAQWLSHHIFRHAGLGSVLE